MKYVTVTAIYASNKCDLYCMTKCDVKDDVTRKFIL